MRDGITALQKKRQREWKGLAFLITTYSSIQWLYFIIGK